MRNLPALPVHPTRRHPLTGEPIRALWVTPNGRVCWPIMGGAPDGGDGGGEGGSGNGGTGGSGGDGGGAGGAGGGSSTGNAVDANGKDLGYPADTRVAEMTAEQQANYFRHQKDKWEGRFRNIAGDKSFDDIRADLDELAEIRKSQQTPAEQAINEAREQGKAEARADAASKAATAIFRASLEAQEHDEKDIDELVENFNVANFIKDGDVDTGKLAAFAKRFAPADTASTRRTRDYGGGNRGGDAGGDATSAGKSEAQRRFKKDTKTD